MAALPDAGAGGGGAGGGSAGGLSADAGSSGRAPTVSNLSLAGVTSLTRGQLAFVTVEASDPEGVGQLRFRFAFTGPETFTLERSVTGVPSSITMNNFAFSLTVEPTRAAGAYQLRFTAVDETNLESNALTQTITLQ
jgi:hypothetical protein